MSRGSSTPIGWALLVLLLLDGGLAVATATTVTTVVAQEAATGSAGARTFTFDKLNREYTNEVTEAQPMKQGGIRLVLTSPQNKVRLIHHELRLAPLADGTHQASLDVEFEGGGQVEAEVSIGGAASQLTDEVTVPLQAKTFEGRVAIQRTEAGYVFTALELPERITVAIESQLAGRFLQTCRLMRAMLPLDCNALDTLLSQVVLPLPEAGQSFLLPTAELTEENRRALDRYLGLGS